MLSQQAHLHHLDQTPDFVRKLTIQKQQLEAQAAYEEINQQAKVSPEEVQQYYTAHAAEYDEITVRQFVVRKKAAEPKADPAHPRYQRARDFPRKRRKPAPRPSARKWSRAPTSRRSWKTSKRLEM